LTGRSTRLIRVVREQRLVFGEVAELYDKARPTYPGELVDHLAALAGPDGRVLDVGCGTGKATALLAAEGLGGVGLEPDLAMVAVARRNLVPYPGWSVATGDFEDYLPGPTAAAQRFNLITCAQAWHWLHPDRRFQQAARLLYPGGWLALFWNRTADDHSPIRRDVDAVYADLFPALSPHGTLTAGRPPVGTPPPDADFGEPIWQVFAWVRRYTTTEWTQLAQTHSDHRLLQPQQRRVLLDRLTKVIDDHGGVYDHPYNCWLWTARRL
jgi:SAM-dependent methyltransferase